MLSREEIHDYLLSLPHAECIYKEDWECFLYKLDAKFFALMTHNEPVAAVSLKCKPERSIELRAAFKEVTAGYHLNKTHWNTITIENTLDEELMKELMRHSYELIFASLTKKRQKELNLYE
ncbi:MAG: MmcQ/YjbR family DNA-binding protein [Deferribacteraceae bacterium]|nr:MmcQ/YjbR family DNA-binding protein [Deferribacteraceae bacterium]